MSRTFILVKIGTGNENCRPAWQHIQFFILRYKSSPHADRESMVKCLPHRTIHQSYLQQLLQHTNRGKSGQTLLPTSFRGDRSEDTFQSRVPAVSAAAAASGRRSHNDVVVTLHNSINFTAWIWYCHLAQTQGYEIWPPAQGSSRNDTSRAAIVVQTGVYLFSGGRISVAS